MDDRAYIGFINAHAKRGGRHDDLTLTGEERRLDAIALLVAHAGVIGRGEARAERAGQILGALAGGGVHDRGSARAVRQQLADGRGALARVALEHLDRYVGATKPVNKAVARILEAQLGDDVVLDHGRRGGGECDDRRRAQRGQPLAEHAIIGAKVVAPL